MAHIANIGAINLMFGLKEDEGLVSDGIYS